MKNKIVKYFYLLLITLSCACLFGCTRRGNSDEQIKKQGYKNIVTFDANGGSFNANSDIRYEYTKDGGYLTRPGEYSSVISEVYRSGYTLVGWFEGTKNEDGTIEYGNHAFDFENDTVNSSFTLYAKWLPNFTFELINVYCNLKTGSKITDETTQVKTCLNKYSVSEVFGDASKMKKEGYTFVDFYQDEDLTIQVDEKYYHPMTDVNCKIYAKWYEGTYKFVNSYDDLKKVTSSTSLIILNDIDFEGKTWPFLNNASYSGQIIGNGHVFKNINVTLTDAQDKANYGLFNKLSDAVIEDLKFVDCSYNLVFTKDFVRVGSDKKYGFLVGLAENSTIKNVSFENVKMTLVKNSSFQNIIITKENPYYYGSNRDSVFEGILGSIDFTEKESEEI